MGSDGYPGGVRSSVSESPLMVDTKSPLQSLTINAAVIGLVVQLLAIFGVQIAPETAMEIGSSLNNIISALAILVAIYGRLRATKAIATTPPGEVRCSRLAVGIVLVATLAMTLGGCAANVPGGVTSTVAEPAKSNGRLFVHVDNGLALAEAAAAGLDAAPSAADAGERA